MSGYPSRSTPFIHVYKSPTNKLQIRTEIMFKKKHIVVKRTSVWFDTVEKKHKKRIELQQFNCEESEYNVDAYQEKNNMIDINHDLKNQYHHAIDDINVNNLHLSTF